MINEVIFGAPFEVTQELIDRFKIDLVVNGTQQNLLNNTIDRFTVPKRINKFKLINSGNDMTTERIINRIINHR